ncbi:hypothetical protein [Candidatus Methylocalor cossyra]|uniref:Uncharacterized protein n=1 Tax=Candidatus Methylocalor cossyra TaxID=3108543 RepID=A0ABM9NJQ0_9GAMM
MLLEILGYVLAYLAFSLAFGILVGKALKQGRRAGAQREERPTSEAPPSRPIEGRMRTGRDADAV